MSKIKELQNEIIELYLSKNLTKKEIAKKLGIKYNTLSSFLYHNEIIKDKKLSASMKGCNNKKRDLKMENQEIKPEEKKATKKRVVRKKVARKTTVKKAATKKAVKKVTKKIAKKKFDEKKADKIILDLLKAAISKTSAKAKKEFVETLAKLQQ